MCKTFQEQIDETLGKLPFKIVRYMDARETREYLKKNIPEYDTAHIKDSDFFAIDEKGYPHLCVTEKKSGN